MMRAHPTGLAPLLLAGAVSLAGAGCRSDSGREFAESAEEHELEETPAGPTVTTAEEPPEIFYDLTRYGWYRRGEPLLVDGRAYQPSGPPEPTRARPFVPLGRFQGVAYYVVQGARAPHDVVYVPVYRGYWQPFRPTDAPPAAGQPDERSTGV